MAPGADLTASGTALEAAARCVLKLRATVTVVLAGTVGVGAKSCRRPDVGVDALACAVQPPPARSASLSSGEAAVRCSPVDTTRRKAALALESPCWPGAVGSGQPAPADRGRAVVRAGVSPF
jgi:hypothetical protein